MSYTEAIENTEPESELPVSEQLEDIKEAIKLLVNKAYDLVPKGILKRRAKAYWYAFISMALDEDNEFLGRSAGSIQDTIEELRNQD